MNERRARDELLKALERERQIPMPEPYSNPPRQYDDEIALLRRIAAAATESEEA